MPIAPHPLRSPPPSRAPWAYSGDRIVANVYPDIANSTGTAGLWGFVLPIAAIPRHLSPQQGDDRHRLM
ncbi:MAG: hypothetical protein ACFCVB_23065 [Nodosilinea sp.]